MPSRAAKRRSAIIAALAKGVEAFYPERAGQVLCPTCLSWISKSAVKSLTDAHIVPQAVGGRVSTVICHGCNSKFGARRDKWLGEYIRVFRNEHPIAHSTHRDHFVQTIVITHSGPS